MKLGLHDLKPTGNYLNRRYIYEQDFPDNINPQEGYDHIDMVITAQHMKDFPQLYKDGKPLFYQQNVNYQGEIPTVIQKKDEVKLTGFAHWENAINSCTTIEKPDGIEAFRYIADSSPKLKEVFNKKMEELKNDRLG